MKTTQVDAYTSILPYTSGIKSRIYAVMVDRALIQEEIIDLVRRGHPNMKDHSIRPRIAEMVDDGVILPAGYTRLSSTGREQEVWRLRNPEEPPAPARVWEVVIECASEAEATRTKEHISTTGYFSSIRSRRPD
jgi:hypothetical protein